MESSMRVAVVTRKLKDHDTVVTEVIAVPSRLNDEEAQTFADRELTRVQRQFVRQFVEFTNAKWAVFIAPVCVSTQPA